MPVCPLNHVRFTAVVAAGLLALLAGCSVSEQQLLESSLRDRDASIRRLERQLATAEQQLKDQERELAVLKSPGEDSHLHRASSSRPLEESVAWGSVDQLKIHGLASGVLPGDDGTLVADITVQPLDGQGEIVKVAGELLVRVQQPGATTLLAETSLSSLQSREAWTSGLIGRGYRVELPLNEAVEPGTEVLVTAVLNLGFDRRFTATHLMRVPK